MRQQPSNEDMLKWHRWFAVECNNNGWTLAEKADRTPDEDREMLCLAYAAALHWSKVGTPLNAARADLLLARGHALLQHADLAVHYAKRCLEFCQNNACEDWDVAFAEAEMAYAAAIAGDSEGHAAHYEIAKSKGESLKDPEDRKVFLESFERIPKPLPKK